MANIFERFTRRGGQVQPRFPYEGDGWAAYKSVIDRWVAENRPSATPRELTNLYATSPLVYTASNFRAENLSQVVFEVQDKSTNEPIEGEPIAEYFKHASELVKRIELAWCFTGSALAAKLYNIAGYVTGLRYLNFNLYTLDLDFRVGLKGFRIARSPEQPRYDYVSRDQAFYIYGEDFRSDFEGVGPAEVAFLEAGVSVEVGATLLALFQNMAIPAAIVQPAADSQFIGGVQREDRKLLEDILRSSVKGSRNAGRTIVSPDRWEWLRMQVAFDEFAMPQIVQQSREAVFMAFQVPAELLFPSASGYAQAYEARRAWLQTWLKPRAEWLAEQFTEQVIKPINPDWIIKPTYDRVAGFGEDAERLTGIINARVGAGWMTLADAQREAGREPDPNLEGLYMIGGVPVPAEAIRTYYLTAQAAGQTGVSDPGAGMLPAPFAPKLLGAGTEVLPPQPEKFLPDAVAKELKDWRYLVNRKGVSYPFAAKALPPAAVDFGVKALSRCSTEDDIDNAFRVIEQYYHMVSKKKLIPPPIAVRNFGKTTIS